MTEANLRPSWPSTCLTTCAVFINRAIGLCTIQDKTALHFILLRLPSLCFLFRVFRYAHSQLRSLYPLSTLDTAHMRKKYQAMQHMYGLHPSVCSVYFLPLIKVLKTYGMWCNLHPSQFNEACTQFDEKPVIYTLTSAMKDFWYCLYRLQSSTGYARNSRKTTMHFGSLV